MVKIKGNDIGFVHSKESEDFQPGELSAGDYVYGAKSDSDSSDDSELCVVGSVETVDKAGKDIEVEIIVGRYRQPIRANEPMSYEECSSVVSSKSLTFVPLSKDWFEENPSIFRNLGKDEEMKPMNSDFQTSFCYIFKARRWKATYAAVGLEISYEDLTISDKVARERSGLDSLQGGSKGKAIVVQIVALHTVENKDCGYTVGTCAAVAQFIAVHELQHFLRLCGIFDTMNIPEYLLE